MATYNGVIVLDVSWASLKAFATSKNLAVQYEQSASAYEIFCVDGRIAYKTVIFRGSVPNTIEFNQSTNDADKSDFETNYKDVITNRVTTPSATYDGYAITTANPTLIAGSDGSFIRTLRADSSGRLITVGLGTAGTPAGGILTVQGVQGMTAINTGGTVNTSAPTWVDNQLRPLSLTLSGRLRVDGSEVTQPVSGTVTANAGTGNFTVVQSTAANLRSQTASEATTAAATGTVASLTGGAVTTAAPTYTTGQMNPLSLTTAGALRVDGSGVTQPISGTVTVGNLIVVAGQSTDNTSNSTAKLPVIAAVATTAAPTYTTGNMVPLSTDTAGSLRVTVTSGGGANNSVSNTGATPPAQATYIGGSVTTAAPTYTTGQMNALSLTTAGALRVDGSGSTQPVSGTVTANAGTGNFTVVQGTAANLRAQTSSESNTGAAPPAQAGLAGGSVTTAAPTYTTGQMSALSLTTAGALRVDGSAVTQPVSGTVTANAGTGNFTVVQSTATNLNATVVPGPGSIGNAWWQRITDGTNTAAVKASSAPAVNSDPALVVTMSPNSVPVQIGQTDTSVVGTLGALNATVTITTSGKYTIGGTITGTWVGTITAEGTVDGTNWFTVRTANKSTNDIVQTYTANDSFEFYSAAGCVGLRLRMSAYTSGTANVTLTGTSLATDAFLNYSGPDGDGAPPLRHVSIATLSADGTLHSPRNSNTDPVGDEYGFITRSIGYGDQQTSFSPDGYSRSAGTTGVMLVDDSNNLQVRGQVLTDEGSFRDDFPGTTLTPPLTGTVNWTNASTAVTGTGTLFTTQVKAGDYIKKTADANTLFVRILSVESNTALTLETAYTGTTAGAASVRSNWIPTIGASGAIAVTTSTLTITTGTTSGVINSVIRRGDYGPNTLRMYASVSQRIANQELRIGFSDVVSSLTPNIAAYVSFTGTTNTTCNFVTSSSVAASDTQTTAVTLPSGTTATLHEYKIDVGGSQTTLSIDGVVVARHTIHIPSPYDNLDLMFLAANTAAAGSSTTLTVDYAYFMNLNRVQVDTDFNGEGLFVQGAGIVGSPTTTGVISAQSPDNSFSGAFTGLNSTWTVTMTGSRGIGFYLAAGTLIGTIVAELSFDGVTWFTTSMTDPVANITSNSLVFTSNNTAVVRSIELIAGVYQARVRISAFTSGTCNITIRSTTATSSTITTSSTDGTRLSYSAGFTGLVPASTPTDVWSISGSATRTIRLTRITFTGTQATGAQRNVIVHKRSTANTGGTSTTATAVPHDSNNAAATATIRGYTANPTALGTSVGVIRTRKVFIGGTGGNSDEFVMEFGTRNDQSVVLRGTNESVCINLNGVTSGTGSLNISVTWTEE